MPCPIGGALNLFEWVWLMRPRAIASGSTAKFLLLYDPKNSRLAGSQLLPTTSYTRREKKTDGQNWTQAQATLTTRPLLFGPSHAYPFSSLSTFHMIDFHTNHFRTNDCVLIRAQKNPVEHIFLVPKHRSYFCVPSQMAWLGFFLYEFSQLQCRDRESNPRQRTRGTFWRTLYRLSFTTAALWNT